MSIRIATFNIENLIARFDFTGYRNQLKSDRVLKLFDIKCAWFNEEEYCEFFPRTLFAQKRG